MADLKNIKELPFKRADIQIVAGFIILLSMYALYEAFQGGVVGHLFESSVALFLIYASISMSKGHNWARVAIIIVATTLLYWILSLLAVENTPGLSFAVLLYAIPVAVLLVLIIFLHTRWVSSLFIKSESFERFCGGSSDRILNIVILLGFIVPCSYYAYTHVSLGAPMQLNL